MSNDQQTMIPAANPVVDIAGKPLEIKRMKVRHITPVVMIIKPFAAELKAMGKVAGEDLPMLVMQHTPQVIELVSVLSDVPVDQVGEWEIPDLINVFAKLLEVNIDFFIQSVIPSLSKAVGGFSAVQLPQALSGLKPSNS